MHIPQNEKNSLNLFNNILIFQLVLISQKSFSIEIGVSDSMNTKKRFFLSSSSNKLSTNLHHCKIPLTKFPLNKWINFYINIYTLFPQCFPSLTLKTIDSIIITGNLKIRKVFSVKNQNEPIPKSLNLPNILSVCNFKIDKAIQGLVEFEQSLNENIDNWGDNKKNEIIDDKKNKAKSKGKIQKNINVKIQENGGNRNNESLSLNFNDNIIIERRDNNDNIVCNNIGENEIHQKEYVTLSQKAKNNIKFNKKISNLQQKQNTVKYDQKGRKLQINSNEYEFANSNESIGQRKRSPIANEERSEKTQIKNKKGKNNKKVSLSPEPVTKENININNNSQEIIKSNNFTNSGSKKYINKNQKEKNNIDPLNMNDKILSTFNLNDYNNKPVTNLVESIEEIYEFNDNGTILEDPILNRKENNNENIIHIDNDRNDNLYDNIFDDDHIINFTVETNRPFTPPITTLVPINIKVGESITQSKIAKNNLIIEKDKEKIKNSINYYNNLVFDKEKGYYYNPKTKMYYDIKD